MNYAELLSLRKTALIARFLLSEDVFKLFAILFGFIFQPVNYIFNTLAISL